MGSVINESILDAAGNNDDIDGLRQLEREIKKAYVLKSLDAQLTKREADKLSEHLQASVTDRMQQLEIATELEEKRIRDAGEKSRIIARYKMDLESQITDKRDEQFLNEIEDRIEREALIETDRISDEQEIQSRIVRKEEMADQLLSENIISKKLKEVAKLKELEDNANKLERDEIYKLELEERQLELNKLQETRRKEREEAIKNVSDLLLKMGMYESERREILVELLVENVKRDVELETKESEYQLREAWLEQIELENECRRKFLEREKAFAQEVMAQIMKSEKMEQMTSDTRRRHMLDYRKELEEVMEERVRTRELEFTKLKQVLAEERRFKLLADEKVKRARECLLEQHIDNVAEFMNEKLLNEQEIKMVRDSIQKRV